MEPPIEQMQQALSKAPTKRDQTVKNAQRMAYPGVYGRPDEVAAMAASRVAPEDPALKQLFGVTRADMYEAAKDRKGMPHLGMLPGAAANPRGSESTEGVMNKRNEQRLLDVMAEAGKHQGLVHGMDPWYYMDPMFEHMVQLVGPQKAAEEYKKMNALMGMASSASEVNTEIPRGSLAYWLQRQGRFDEFVKHGGKRDPNRPADFGEVPGHLAHKTAHAVPMKNFLTAGNVDMSSPKVPMYIEASGVPAIGFQTRTPVGDAHWSRAVGLADTRNTKMMKGKEMVPGQSVTTPEMSALGPWWAEKIAKPLGLESVPAQARAWGAFSPQTGVTTPIGAPKLELIAKQIMLTAKRLGIPPEKARDLVLTGQERMGLAEGGTVGYADGGSVEPTQDQMLAHVMLHKTPDSVDIRNVGVNEAPDLPIKAYVPPNGGDGAGLPIGGVDFQPLTPGNQLMPQQPGQPQGGPPPAQPPQGGMPPPGAPGAPPPQPGQPQSNILSLTPQGQAMQAMRPSPQAMPRQPGPTMPKMSKGGTVEEMRRAIADAAKSSGMKAPVVANKSLMNVEDFHQSLGDAIRKQAGDMQNLMESMPFKYDKGHHVFTKWSADKNKPPYKILSRTLYGNNPVREDHPTLGPGMGKHVKDPDTGKTKRTPYEPGYKVRMQMGPDDWHESVIPESAILGHLKAGGSTNDIELEERPL